MISHSLHELAQIVGGTIVNDGDATLECHSVTASSSHVEPGALFVAIRGFSVDGHAFVSDAFARGALAAVVEDAHALGGKPGIVVSGSRSALSRLAAAFHGDPSTRMRVVGITGTNGKTTTNWIVYQLLHHMGEGALRIGTLGSEYLGGNRRDGGLTSPDPLSIHSLLAEAERAGARSCVMETSSHALDQSRLDDVEFDVGVFTNLTRDHLDYHQTFENYFAAKRKLFTLLSRGAKGTKAAVVNIDDPHGLKLMGELRALGLYDWSFGSSDNAAIRISSIREVGTGMVFSLHVRDSSEIFDVNAPFIGRHNAENVVAAFASCMALGYRPEAILKALPLIAQVPGRLERVGTSGPRVFVDYAHTPDALERALIAVRPSTEGKLWVVFGCGGDRDRGKRPEMGAISARVADEVVVTSDNPRTEVPEKIIEDILASGVQARVVDVDRRAAIGAAISQAAPGDTIVIAGKGHEDYQIIGKEKLPFSDQEVALAFLSGLKSFKEVRQN
jgi:UDP-N-acetylmuramoyl-L-alanyl-D-glutamate--2,6-diaminopimelate ligase